MEKKNYETIAHMTKNEADVLAGASKSRLTTTPLAYKFPGPSQGISRRRWLTRRSI
jgi:hypothetical protein